MIVRRLFIGEVTVDLDGWPHLRTVRRIQTDVFDRETGEQRLRLDGHRFSRRARGDTIARRHVAGTHDGTR